MTLTNEMTWSELCEHTLNKLKDDLKGKDITAFKDWFMVREKLGYCFDPILILRAFRVWQDLQRGLDHFVVIEGREGLGKSTLGVQFAAWVSPDFALDNLVNGADGFVRVLKIKSDGLISAGTYKNVKADALILDEGNELLSRESQNNTNRMLIKTFNVQRALNYLVIVCAPNFFFLDKALRNHRARTLIVVSDRGKYTCFTGKAIKIIAEIAKNTKNSLGVKVPDGTFWRGYFNKDFPKTINYEEYLKIKHKGINDLLGNLQTSPNGLYVKAVKASRELGMHPERLTKQIKDGKLKGKQLGKLWYLERSEYERLMGSHSAVNSDAGG